MNYIYLFPKYIQAKEAFTKLIEKCENKNLQFVARFAGMEITAGEDRHIFKVVPIDVHLEGIMGMLGTCDARVVLEYLDSLKRRIEAEVIFMAERQKNKIRREKGEL